VTEQAGDPAATGTPSIVTPITPHAPYLRRIVPELAIPVHGTSKRPAHTTHTAYSLNKPEIFQQYV
jgi:hypothetical protein